MKSALYRYPHPYDPTKFIYVGQVLDADKTRRRDTKHRAGKGSFGRRFKNKFPDAVLPDPIYEFVEVKDYLELNELETIWMFRYHTWYKGYADGMNITFPGSLDYKTLGHISAPFISREHHVRAGRLGGQITGPTNVRESRGIFKSGTSSRYGLIQGRKSAESGQVQSLNFVYGPENTRRSMEKELGIFSPNFDRVGRNRKALCSRWNIKRGRFCTCGKHDDTKS